MNKATSLGGLLLCAVLVCVAQAGEPDAATPVSISPADPLIRYVGRFDTRDAAGPKCSWAGCSVQLKFTGTAVAARIKASGNEDYLQVIVDGKTADPLKLTHDQSEYLLASGLPDGEHTLELFKRTESFVGTIQFMGFYLQKDKVLKPIEAPTRKIQIIGDSITCGYGNEGTDKSQHFTVPTENNYLSYGAIAARNLKADYQAIAWSGRKMWPDNTMPEIYDLSIPTDPTSKIDLTAWKPDVIIINLGTNDFGKFNPDEQWVAAYAAFIRKLRGLYPNAKIVCAEGSMMNDDPSWHGALAAARKCLQQMIADFKAQGVDELYYLDFTPQKAADGFGADWHPNLKTHRDMAETLTAELKKIMKW